jgi:hypothetical protein
MAMENLTAVLYKTEDLRLEHRPVQQPGQGQVTSIPVPRNLYLSDSGVYSTLEVTPPLIGTVHTLLNGFCGGKSEKRENKRKQGIRGKITRNGQ